MAGKGKATTAPPKVFACSCVHAYQDKRYGKGRRLHNATLGKTPSYRCTVCGRIKL